MPWTWRNWLIFVVMFVAGVAISPPVALAAFALWGLWKTNRVRKLEETTGR